MPDAAGILEQQIDALYALPPGEFVAARTALAKTLKGDDAARVKKLEKPTSVPWAVNQLYWHDRRAYDRLMTSGHTLRAAQIAALKGKQSDLRAATAGHRTALADAVSASVALAEQADVHPSIEPLTRMLEALSLSSDAPGTPGRFTEVLQPAGFEALAGITPVARPAPKPARPPAAAKTAPRAADRNARSDEQAERTRSEQAAARKAADAAVDAARRQLDRARASEARAQTQVDAARQQLERTESALAEAKAAVHAAEADLTSAEAARRAR